MATTLVLCSYQANSLRTGDLVIREHGKEADIGEQIENDDNGCGDVSHPFHSAGENV